MASWSSKICMGCILSHRGRPDTPPFERGRGDVTVSVPVSDPQRPGSKLTASNVSRSLLSIGRIQSCRFVVLV
jgi:hypothetical protein